MIKQRLKYALYAFLGVTGLGLVSGVLYLQSERFANSVKRMISQRSPDQLGVVGDFSNLKLYFFPPGIGVASPKMQVSKDNIAKIPLDGQLEAKELRVSFSPIELFSGVLQVSEVQVSGGAIQGKLYAEALTPKSKRKKEISKLSWHDLFDFQINGVHLDDTYLNLQIELPGEKKEEVTTELVVKDLILKKARMANRREGFISTATVSAVHVTLPASLKNFPVREANQLQWDVELTDKGLRLNPFTADLSGIRFRLDGSITGNLLDEKADPLVEAEADIHSDLGTFFNSNLNDSHWTGQVDAKARIAATLKHPADTLKTHFTLSGENISWKDMHAKKIEGEADLDLKQKKIALKSLKLEDDGKVKISSSEIPFQFNEPFQGEVEMEGADIHWLGGAVAAAVKPLEGKITGKIKAQFSPNHNKNWILNTEEALHVEHFALLANKTPVLNPPEPVHVNGTTVISPAGVEFKDLKVGLIKTQLMVSGGVHSDKAGGFGISGKGPIDLKEFDKIADNEIRGEGTIDVKVHGPVSNVALDFMAKVKESGYLGMHFGNLEGMVTYDDGVSELRFEGIRANYKNTFYSLDQGFIDLSGGDDLRLPIDLHAGRIEDIAEILDKIVKKISWYPKNLKGELHGKVLVHGKIDMPRMKVQSDIEGSDWQLLGERARKVKMSVGVDEGTYFARNVAITKTTGTVKGDVSFEEKSESLNWNLTSENLSFVDIDFLDRLELPAKSKIEITSRGEGPMNRMKSLTEARLYGTEFKGESFEPSKLILEVGESTLRANLDVFGGRLSSQMKYALVEKQPSSFRIDLDEFDFSPALLVLNPKLLDDPALVGDISGHLKLDFLSTQSEFARGNLEVKKYQLGKTGFLLSLLDPVNVPIQLGYFHFPQTRLKFNNAELVLAGEGKRGEVDLTLKGQIDLAIAELVSSAVTKASGKAETDIHITGPFKAPDVSGQLTFKNSRVLMKWLQSPFEGLDGTVRLRRGLLTIENIDAYLGEEAFSLTGTIDTFTNRFPEMNLRGQFQDNKIKMAPLDLVQVRGVATITGSDPPYVIAGNLEVPQALYSKGFGGGASQVTSRGDRFLPIDQEKQSASNLFKLDLSVNAPQGFVIRNELMDAEFRGKVKVIGPPDNPRLLGDANLVQGKVNFRDRSFIFENAKVEFDDPLQLNPKFSAAASSEVNQYKIRVLAYGRSDSWKAEFSSTPYLVQSEIFSLLSAGYTSADSTRYQHKDKSYVSQGEAASLILHSMDFSKDVQNKTGFSFDFEEAVDVNSASSVFRPQTAADVASPKLVLKRQLGRNVWFSVGSTVGVGSETLKEVNAEYKLTPAVSALGVWNDIEEINETQTRTSFGLDLKFNKRFK